MTTLHNKCFWHIKCFWHTRTHNLLTFLPIKILNSKHIYIFAHTIESIVHFRHLLFLSSGSGNAIQYKLKVVFHNSLKSLFTWCACLFVSFERQWQSNTIKSVLSQLFRIFIYMIVCQLPANLSIPKISSVINLFILFLSKWYFTLWWRY